MPNIKCKICSKAFYAKPCWVKRGAGKYCSPECQHKGSKTGKDIKCYICGRESYKTVKQISRSKSGKFFCGKSCQTKWRNAEYIGPKHANWKHGQYVYKSILKRSSAVPRCGLCGLGDARALAVHHIDKDHKNNRVENLLWLCHNCHHLVHNYEIERVKLEGLLKRNMVPVV